MWRRGDGQVERHNPTTAARSACRYFLLSRRGTSIEIQLLIAKVHQLFSHDLALENDFLRQQELLASTILGAATSIVSILGNYSQPASTDGQRKIEAILASFQGHAFQR
jgi:hypothetical protein